MKYILQVLKGRSDVTSLRLIDGVNSVGRHDDCVIRIRSSQVSRRHCEIFEADDRLVVRDLGSSNGTFVNGLRVLGQQPLKPGDVITIGGVALRVDPLGGPVPAAAAVVSPASGGDATDADALIDDEVEVIDAVEIDEPDDFEISADVAEIDPDDFVLSDAIPLEEEPALPPPPEAAPAESKKKKKKKSKEKEEAVDVVAEPEGQDDAVAQFLMDLKLDEND